jgi:hypothetical protein
MSGTADAAKIRATLPPRAQQKLRITGRILDQSDFMSMAATMIKIISWP